MSAKKLTAAQVLERAADLIEPADAWIRDYTAMRVDIDNNNVRQYTRRLATDKDATCWGGVGAIYKIGRAGGLSNPECHDIQRAAAEHVGVTSGYFSDWAWAVSRTQVEVVEALRGAARAVLAQAA